MSYFKIENEASRVFEQVGTAAFETAKEASIAVAREIADLIISKQQEGKPCILGMATGSTPKYVYAELIRLHKKEKLSFKNVIAFNLDEYYPMQADALQSYVRFMKEQLFDHVDISPDNINIPDGTLAKDEIIAYCKAYEAKIESHGGIDLQILGIGGNGHIGFNEPGAQINSKTRMVALDYTTRAAAQGDFFGLENTPRRAITLGVQKIMDAKRIVLMAWGEGKSKIVKQAVEGPITDHVPASFLQSHDNVTFILDEGAAFDLTRISTPWLVDTVEWTDALIKKAVVSLARKMGKPILMLTDQDYNENGLNDLLAESGPSYEINIKVFNQLQRTVTGWPGGKPRRDDRYRPERAEPAQKRVLIFSPHPDDDIISMGGTFLRLHEQGHDVHVGYQVSGNIAVTDDEAVRFADFVSRFNKDFGFDNKDAQSVYDTCLDFSKNKKSSEIDTDSLRKIKGLIRQGEALATCRYVGLPDENAHFMNLPFYETGTVEKKPYGKEDVKIIVDLIKEIKPHQIFAAGDLADPHGTHKVCLDAIFAALEELKNESYMDDCWVWLYRGAWAEWDIEQVEMAVPMSPGQVLQKRHGIWKHQSQKDGVVYQGSDAREFWQRAEDRNAETASIYNDLGLSEYAAMEAFRRYHFQDEVKFK